MKRFLIIDANSLIHRAYHALPPLTSSKGEPTGAVYGFTSMALKALKDLRPDYAAAAFDLPGPTFRHKEFKEYKAARPPTPEDLAPQLEKSKEVLRALGIATIGMPGFEADDIIGTLTAAVKNNPELEVIILSGDLDTLQLASDRVKIAIPKKGISDITSYDRQAVEERYGFGPEFLIDYKALRGDTSDNIPGVPGIGEKTAVALIAQFGTIENLYRELEKSSAATQGDEKRMVLAPNIRKKLIAGKDKAFLSKALAAINTSVPINTSLVAYAFTGPDKSRAEKLFSELGFKTLIPRLKDVR
jgi:DNA polymerase-1